MAFQLPDFRQPARPVLTVEERITISAEIAEETITREQAGQKGELHVKRDALVPGNSGS